MQDAVHMQEGPQVVTGTSWSRFEVGAEEVVWEGLLRGPEVSLTLTPHFHKDDLRAGLAQL